MIAESLKDVKKKMGLTQRKENSDACNAVVSSSGVKVSSGRPRKGERYRPVGGVSSSTINEERGCEEQGNNSLISDSTALLLPHLTSSHSTETDRSSDTSENTTPRKLSGMSPSLLSTRHQHLDSTIFPQIHTGRILRFRGKLSEDDREARKEIEVEGMKAIEQDIGEIFEREKSVLGCDGCGAGKPLSTLTVVKPCSVSVIRLVPFEKHRIDEFC